MTTQALFVNATLLEQKVRDTDNVNPKKRLLIYTADPATGDAGPTCFSVPWASTNLSQTWKTFKAALPGAQDEDDIDIEGAPAKKNEDDDDGDDDGEMRPVTRFTIPDCEADALMLLAMYCEFYADKPEYVGASGKSTVKPDENGSDAAGNKNPLLSSSGISAAAASKPKPGGSADGDDLFLGAETAGVKSAKSLGAHHLERPYKPNQMEVDLKTVAASESCLDGFERHLADHINKMERAVAVRALRGLLCAGWFLSMNQSFLDLVGWLLSLRFRGNNVHQIKEMMKDSNIAVRKDKI